MSINPLHIYSYYRETTIHQLHSLPTFPIQEDEADQMEELMNEEVLRKDPHFLPIAEGFPQQSSRNLYQHVPGQRQGYPVNTLKETIK